MANGNGRNGLPGARGARGLVGGGGLQGARPLQDYGNKPALKKRMKEILGMMKRPTTAGQAKFGDVDVTGSGIRPNWITPGSRGRVFSK
jgi:hypothetical protein